MVKKTICSVLAAAFFSVCVFAGKTDEQKTKTSIQHQVTVTANRVETPENEVATSLTIITREDLQRMKQSTVIEALEGILGLFFTQNGPPGSAASILIRGANAEHTKIMIDGVDVNDPITPGRTFDLSLLLVDSIDRIEILRGPQSPLYGSDAMAGTINIITRKRTGKTALALSSRAGSFGTQTLGAQISGGQKNWHYSFGSAYQRTVGISAASSAYPGNREKDGMRNLSYSGRAGLKLGKHISADLILKSIQSRMEIDNFGGAYGDDPNSVQTYDAFFLKTGLRGLFLSNRWEQKLSFSLVNYDRHYENPSDAQHPFSSDNAFYKSRIFKLDWQNNLFLHETNTLTFGVEFLREQGESESRSASLFGSFLSLFPLKKADLAGIYIQDKIRVSEHFFAAVGARLDIHDKFGSALTFRIAPSYEIKATGTRFKATFGSGFKAPSLYQLYAPGTAWGPVGSENLRPESSTGWDAGIEQSVFGNRLLIGMTYFSNDYTNLILFDFSKGYKNIGKAYSKGWELSAKGHLFENLSFSTAYTRIEAKDQKTQAFLLRRPEHQFSARMHYSYKDKAALALQLVYIGKRRDVFWLGWSQEEVNLDAFTLLNAVFSYAFLPMFDFYMRFDNLLDTKYELVKGYGALGFAFYAGINLKIQ